MGFPRLSLFIFMPLLFLLSQLHLSSPFMQPLCHRDDSSALLQFKKSFIIDESASCYDFFENELDNLIYEPKWIACTCQKVASWIVERDKGDCCSWDGVECDKATGHVIGLDLSASCLKGSINSSSSLFRLVYLQSLNLAYNDFNYSQIPSQVRNLSRLTHLNLSSSYFSGQIPLEISQLSHLSSLDLSDTSYKLELKNPSLRSLVGNLTHLQKLDLSRVNISSTMPNILANLSSLTFLSLRLCGLYGEVPVGIFKLSNLRLLSVRSNAGLTGYLPDFTWSSPLEKLDLAFTNFSGELPASMGNLGFLTKLVISGCKFSGSIPSSLGNLTQLVDLRLSYNNFVGNIPHSLGNLVQLSSVDLSNNLLSGEMHFGLMNLTQLCFLDLSANNLHGIVEFNEFVKLKHLTTLNISSNQLSLLTKETNANATLQKFEDLGFSSCNLSEFPNFLRNQDKLRHLDLSNNKIHGQVPKWMWNTSTTSLEFLDLSNNSLTSFGQHPIFLPWTNLDDLDLTSNLLQGSLPIPPISTRRFYISKNSLTGNVPELFCNLSSLQVLDLAINNLNGSLPRCLDNFGASLFSLDLRRNNFEGSFPETWTKGSKLQIINFSRNKFQGHLPRSLAGCAMLQVLDLSNNQFDHIFPLYLENLSNLEVLILRSNKFQGHLPRSLAKCTMLKVLDLNNNQFNDRFPSWLKNLPNLEVLILRSNKFNGPITTFKSEYMFPKLQIIDLSYNSFIGKLPLKLFSNSKAKTFEIANYLTYIQVSSAIWYKTENDYDYCMTMTNKGKVTFYEKVQELFMAVDMSSNRFVGEISESIENLRGFHLLNLSNNALTGHIPPSLGSLMDLEALDLSQNNLSGEIPQQLTQLNFLEFLNVSHNNLTGLIPQGKQFDTFENNSFEGNPGLCGRPLTRKCGNSNGLASQPSIFKKSQDSGSLFEFGWKIVMIGYGFGFVVGVIIGQIVVARKHDWLMKTLRIRPVNGRRRRN